MTRIAITILSITLIALAGCGEDSKSENGGNGEHYIASYFEASFDQGHAGLAAQCECGFAEMDYADADECYEDNAVPESNRDEAVSCFTDALDDYDSSPPQSVGEYFECLADGFSDGGDCIESATDADGEVCSEDADAERETCESDMNTALEACDDALDEEGQDWMDESDESEELDSSFEACFDILEGEE